MDRKQIKWILTLTYFFVITLCSGQDVITMRNGDEIKAKVTEVGVDQVKYKKFDNPDGPVYSSLKTDIFMIRYENGTKDVMPTPTTTAPAPVNPSPPIQTAPPNQGNTQRSQPRSDEMGVCRRKIISGSLMTGFGYPMLFAGVAMDAIGGEALAYVNSAGTGSGDPLFVLGVSYVVVGSVLTIIGLPLSIVGPIKIAKGVKCKRQVQGSGATIEFNPAPSPSSFKYDQAKNYKALGVRLNF